uniref:Uncharacterized protein n=1 Tax=Timema bartmani TaxID=61472 RepID=A0A7R9F582_9NEOP|nr:unnamed protein product [Timema bartmani]
MWHACGEYVVQSQLMWRHCHQQTTRRVLSDMMMPVANIDSSEVVDLGQSPCGRHTSLNVSKPSGGCMTLRPTSLATHHAIQEPRSHHATRSPSHNFVVHCKRDDLLPVVNLELWKDHNQHK